MMKNALAAGLFAALLLGPAPAFSQQAEDLKFPTEPTEFSAFRAPQMSLYKPEGVGPFPALVLMHQCGGLGSSIRWRNESMVGWAREAVARGYVVLLVDSLSQRGVDTVCYGPKAGINFYRGLKDALQAAEHLQKLDYVDRKRIAMAGFSWGAMIGVLASSKGASAAQLPGVRFAAVASLYPGCFTVKTPAGGSFEILRGDIDRPLLMLMGEEDTETPAAECMAKLAPVQAAGAPVRSHLYSQTTHCWDCKNLDGRSKIDVRGNRVVYRYSKDTTDDSVRRVFEFFAAAMRP